ncbi:hypothetical protein ASPCAL08953 [Aspergillus calidoustus]|uniref:Uncharacterized protein n=1 Tax=Aspergillus calidoustus TaxID=454130 RepID=A0A0U5GVP6_ASPCI|nr:hypothetical protein ASPCAL08953 [Aspergillus calidoustus]
MPHGFVAMAQLGPQGSELQLLPPQPDENEMPPSETDGVQSLSHASERQPDPDRPSSSAASGAQDYVEGWPVGPRRLKSNAQSDIFSTMLEVITAFCPIAFLALAIIVIRLDGDEVSDATKGYARSNCGCGV